MITLCLFLSFDRPFKALLPGSNPGRPNNFLWLGFTSCAVLAGITSARRTILTAALRSIKRGSNHTTLRFGDHIELIAAKEQPSMTEARKLEQALKRKKESLARNFNLAVR
jgi:hypothetical protein